MNSPEALADDMKRNRARWSLTVNGFALKHNLNKLVRPYPVNVSDLVYLGHATTGENGSPREEGKLQIVRRTVWEVLHEDDTAVVSASPRELARMMDAIVAACQEFGLTVSEKKIEAIHLWSDPSTASNAVRIKVASQ